jgi:ATP/maltotriose-dependent transcriptional regulator MalT/DNA-binding SARP family transcriptional activator
LFADGFLALRRPRLEQRLDGAFDGRLTTLVAGAGSGKTTLLEQWSQNHQIVRHALSAGDRELSSLARSVVAGLRLRIPALSPDLLLAAEGTQGPDADSDELTRADAFAALICQELESRARRDLVLVLDDLHEIDHAAASVRLVESLIRHASARFHVVLASRSPIPFPIGRLQVERQVNELPAFELAFNLDELEQLLMSLVGPDAVSQAAAIEERTGGWPAAARLAAEALRLRPPGESGFTVPGNADPMYAYLAEEVMGFETPPVRRFLTLAAHLPILTRDLCEQLDLPGGPELFARLLGRGIYFSPVDLWPGAITLTPLMRDFILAYAPLLPGERESLLRAAAAWYEAAGANGEAFACLRAIGEPEEIGSYLESQGPVLLSAGLSRVVIDAIGRLPTTRRSDRIAMIEGEARQITGDWAGAQACYSTVVPPDGPLPAALAWRYGLLHHLRGDVEAALAIYRRGLQDAGHPHDEALLLGWMASAHWLHGDRDLCRESAELALEKAQEARNPRALATAHTVLAMLSALDGDRLTNDAHYLRALEHAERAHDVLQTIRIRVNRGSRNLEEGAFDEAMEELDIAVRLADLAGFASFRGLALSNRGQAHQAVGRLEEAVADLEEARAIFRRTGSRLEAYPLTHLGDVYRARGDVALARAAYEEAIHLSEGPGDLQGLVPSLSGLALTILDEDPARAAELAARAIANGAVLGHVRALLASAWVARATGDTASAARLAARAGEVARARRDRPGMAEAIELSAWLEEDKDRRIDLFERAQRVWRELGDPLGVARIDIELADAGASDSPEGMAMRAEETLRRLGALDLARRARRVLASLESRRQPHLAVRTLGGFAVVRDGEKVPSAEWQSRKARDLLKMLVANRGRPLHREVLIDRLWPDESTEKGSNRLSVALSTVRSVLDPGRLHPADRYLSGDRESVGLALDHLSVDAEFFITRAEQGLQLFQRGERTTGMAAMVLAEARYVGDFLEEDAYEDWAIGLREQCRSVYMKIAAILAEQSVATGDHEGAGRLYLRMLERDPYHEPAHLGLVSAMMALGRHGAARRLYGVYVTRMNELAIEPVTFPSR